jgi:hypothetical protein
MEGHRLRMFEIWVLRRIFGPTRDEVTQYGEEYIMINCTTFILHHILFTCHIASRRGAFRLLC